MEAVWRAFMPSVPGLVYLNGVYVEHYEPGRELNIGRPGIYLPPSMLRADNELLFVALDPRSSESAFADQFEQVPTAFVRTRQ